MPIDPHVRTTRRAVVNAALGAAGAFAVSAATGVRPVAATATGNVQLGAGVFDNDNDCATETRVNSTTAGIVALSGVAIGGGIGLYGYSPTGRGVLGIGGDTAIGVSGQSSAGTGAAGASYTGAGVYGYQGSSEAPPISGPVAGVVASAADTSALALRVTGRAAFDFSGKATVAKNKSSVVVVKAGVTSASLVIATPRTNRAGVYVQAVVAGAGKFTIYLNKIVPGATGIAYMILG